MRRFCFLFFHLLSLTIKYFSIHFYAEQITHF